ERRRRARSLSGTGVEAEPAGAWTVLVSAPARALALGARSHGGRLSPDGPRLPRARAGAEQAAGGGMVPDRAGEDPTRARRRGRRGSPLWARSRNPAWLPRGPG